MLALSGLRNWGRALATCQAYCSTLVLMLSSPAPRTGLEMRRPVNKSDPYGGMEKKLLGRFTQVPNTILFRHDLSAGAKLVWMVLKAHKWNEQSPFPSQERVGAGLGVTRQSVSIYIKELKTKGLIRVRRQGSRRTAEYDLDEY